MSTKLPDGWRRARLGDICREDRTPASPAESLPYLGMDQVESETGAIHWNGTEPHHRTGFRFDGRHVLYGKLRPYLNKVAAPDRGGHCSTELVPLLPLSGVDRQFLAYLLRRPETVIAAMSERTGSQMPRANMRHVLSLEIPLPPLVEQRRIAAILAERLDAAEHAKSAVQAQIEAARALPAAYLREAFESAEARAWLRVRLGEVLSRRSEVIHPGNGAGEALFVGLEHIESGTGRRIGALPTDLGTLTGRKPAFHAGDLVYGYLRPYLNKVWIAEFDGVCSVDQYVYQVNEKRVHSEFAAWFMRSPSFLTSAPINKSPGQLPRIRLQEIAAVLIPLPPFEKQAVVASQIAEGLDGAAKISGAASTTFAEIDRFRTATLRAAFEGHL